jgi:hypothetical protein
VAGPDSVPERRSVRSGHGTEMGISYDKEVSIAAKGQLCASLKPPVVSPAPGLLAPYTILLIEGIFREEFGA